MARSEIVKLLSDLGSEDRLTLLSETGKAKLRLVQLSKKISASIQETSRHAGRLSDGKLIERDPEGYYRITTFGKAITSCLEPFDFLSKNKEYCMAHNVPILPAEFMARIGELAQCEFREGISGVLRHIEEVIAQAREYVWLMADQAVIAAPFLEQAFRDRDVSIRLLAPMDMVRQQRDFQQVTKMLGRKLELRASDKVQIGIAMNENLSGVCFPDINGKIDFNRGFRGNDSKFHKWCYNLYAYHWDNAKPPA